MLKAEETPASQPYRPRPGLLWLKTAVLWCMFALLLTGMGQITPTFDEQGFIVRGLAYLRGAQQTIRVGHPLGLNALNAGLLVNDPTVALPVADPSWAGTNFHRPAELFLWEIGNDVTHTIFLARLPTIWLGLLLAALTACWAGQMARNRPAGLLALLLIAFDPNILAHSRLATTDLGLALGAALAGFTLWRFLKRPSWPAAVIAGAGFGLLQNTKFTAGLFVPLLALVMLVGLLAAWHRRRRFPVRPLGMLLLAYPLAAFVTLWATNGFQIGTLPETLPVLNSLGGTTLPLSHHLEQLLDIGGRLQVETPAFLAGQYSNNGWWYYFPVTFLLKTPLPLLLLLGTAVVLRLLSYRRPLGTAGNSSHLAALVDDAALLIPAGGYFLIALTSEINLGYRHLLTILPFLAVFIANSLAPYLRRPHTLPAKIVGYGTVGLATSLVFISLWIHPHYLSFFNRLAGGPDNGWHYLVDSNIDWGQDLAALKTWLTENEVDQVWLSYFGEARPDYYGINYQGLDSWPPRLWNPLAQPFYPHDPPPGLYAISVTNLQGVHFEDHDQFAWFRQRQPLAKIGYSLFLYEVPAYGEPAAVSLGGLQLAALDPADFSRFGTNQVIPRWFEPDQGLLLPGGDNRWLVLATGTPLPFAVDTSSWETVSETDAYTLFRLPPAAAAAEPAVATFSQADGRAALETIPTVTTANDNRSISVVTTWRQLGPPRPFKLFLHLLDENEAIIAQWDGLSLIWEGWHPGDRFQQRMTLDLPLDLTPGTYALRAGLYDPFTAERWLTETGVDSIDLDTVILGE